jgi:hypothetical protein
MIDYEFLWTDFDSNKLITLSKGEESGIVGLAATEYISFYPANRN